VQAYIAAMPDWKRDVGRRLDALIEGTVPDVRKAVKWNSPFFRALFERPQWSGTINETPDGRVAGCLTS
jgi:hypothetical protein